MERNALTVPSPGFSLYAIIFEVVSAFGTVGLSFGVPYDLYAFSGAWRTLSKIILMAVMLRGRHRGLPMAIDRAVLLPGEDMMEQLDKEYNGNRGEQNPGPVEEENDRLKRGNQAENTDEGQNPK